MSGTAREQAKAMRRDVWANTRRFFEALEELRAEEARCGPVKTYTLKSPPRPKDADSGGSVGGERGV